MLGGSMVRSSLSSNWTPSSWCSISPSVTFSTPSLASLTSSTPTSTGLTSTLMVSATSWACSGTSWPTLTSTPSLWSPAVWRDRLSAGHYQHQLLLLQCWLRNIISWLEICTFILGSVLEITQNTISMTKYSEEIESISCVWVRG